MRRNAVLLLLVPAIALATAGCKNKSKAKYDADAAYSADPYAPTGKTTTYAADPYATTYAAPAAADSYSAGGAMGGGRYHTVAKKDTLYSLARQYYGDQSKWRDIYDANRSDIPDPNRIKVGQRLMIP